MRLMLLIVELDVETEEQADAKLDWFRECVQPLYDHGVTISRLQPRELAQFDLSQDHVLVPTVPGELD